MLALWDKVTTKTQDRHPFAELLAQYRQRKPGLSQTRLAELAGYDQAILVRMGQGKKDLTGPSGRERVVRLIETLADQGTLTTLDEANALLLTADLSPLFEKQPTEAKLIARLARASTSHRVRRTNLPAPLSAFIGRSQEVAEVRRLLGETRLLTLTGAGGSGKTRLAQQVAADVLISYPDGVWYAELAALSDASLIPDALARVFGLASTERPVLDQLADFLRERHTLLVLDNCEHLIEAVASFAIKLLSECARLTVLATSREALNVEGELAWRVPPMLPDEAAQMFVERAKLSRPARRLTMDDATVAHICQRLDCMPLAIELAAARLSTMSLNDIVARLDDRFNLLAHGRRGALPRHQTLRVLMDWSYDLLTEPEKMVFRRLGVFVGGWELAQAEPVVSHPQVLPILTQLVSKSLVTMEEREGATRYYLLETIRQYAAEKLEGAGESAVVRNRHLDYFLTLGEREGTLLKHTGPVNQADILKRLERTLDNVRKAMDWAIETGQIEKGLRLIMAMNVVFIMRAGQKEAIARLQVLLKHPAAAQNTRAEAQAYLTISGLQRRQNEMELSSASLERAEAVIFAPDDPRMRADILYMKVGYALELGDFALARSCHDQWQAIFLSHNLFDWDQEDFVTEVVALLGYFLLGEGDYAQAKAYLGPVYEQVSK